MAPPTWLKNQQTRSASFVSLSSSLSASMYDGGPGSPLSRGQRGNAGAALDARHSLQATANDDRKQGEDQRATPNVGAPDTEDLVLDKDASDRSGDQSKPAAGSDQLLSAEEKQK